MEHISKIIPGFVQYAKTMINKKHNQLQDFMATVRVIRSGVFAGFNDLMSLTTVVFSK